MIGYLANNVGTISGEYLHNSRSLLGAAGFNMGNLAFWHATARLIGEPRRDIMYGQRDVQAAGIKVLVIPAANFIGRFSDLAPIVELIRKVDRPTLVIGVGAQAEREDTLPEVPEPCREFLSEIAVRGPFIAVRGEYTAKVCRAFGVENTKVLGCPSLLASPDRHLGKRIAARIKALEDGPVAVHAACHKHVLMNVERELIRTVLVNAGSSYVVQRPPEMVKVLYREALSQEDLALLDKWAPFFGFNSGGHQLRDFLLRYGHVPTSIDSWQAYLRRFVCSINTRIHGTMVTLQAGLPAVCITHDTRTRELAERMKIPRVAPQVFIECRHDIRKLFERAQFDPDEFDAERRKIAQEYVTLLGAFGLEPSAHLVHLAAD